MIDVRIIGEDGTAAPLDREGRLGVVIHPHPPLMDETVAIPFRQYLTDDGSSGGDEDMAVDGSVTAVEYWVSAIANADLYIKTLSVVIGDGGSPALNLYGALSALTNGVEFEWVTQDVGTAVLHDGIKTNLEFMRMGVASLAFGTGTDALLADVSGGGSEKSYLPTIDLAQTYGTPYGVKLRASTTDKLLLRVNDNLSALTTHNAIAYGVKLETST
jgi:hypothetical protein